MLATAEAFRNNCAIHSLAHVWMKNLRHMDDDAINALAESSPVYQAILDEANHYYKQSFVRFSDLVNLDRKFPHPFDREVFWGPILRHCLVNLLDESERALATDYKLLREDHFAVLANALGANVQFHVRIPTGNANKEMIVPLEPSYHADHRLFDLNLYHTQKGGGHYDFDYGNEQENLEHNSQYIIGAGNRRIPVGEAWFARVADTVGVYEQDNVVRTKLHDVLYKPTYFEPENAENISPGNTTVANRNRLAIRVRKPEAPKPYIEDIQKPGSAEIELDKHIYALADTCERIGIPTSAIPQIVEHFHSLTDNLAEIEGLSQDELQMLISSTAASLNEELCHAVENIDLEIAHMMQNNLETDYDDFRKTSLGQAVDEITLASSTAHENRLRIKV